MLDVVTIGTAARDVFLQSKFFKIVRDPVHLKKIGFVTGEAECFALGGKVEVDDVTATTGGGAANAAVTFARQGLKTGAFIRVGQDAAAASIINDLESEGISVNPLRRGKTAYSTILLSSDGERTILVFRGDSSLVAPDYLVKRLSARWAYVVPGGISLPILRRIFDRLHRQGIRIAFAPSRHVLEAGRRQAGSLFEKSDIVLMNREEAALLTGVDFGKEREIFKSLNALVAPGIAVMTDGGRGVLVSDGTVIYEAGVFREKKLADRTGSGDAFGSGFVSALIQQGLAAKDRQSAEKIKKAIRAGSANATSVVEHIGAHAGILTAKQLKDKRWSKFSIQIRRW